VSDETPSHDMHSHEKHSVGPTEDRWLDDAAAETLLSGGRTDREELVSLERFLQEVGDPRHGPRPRPSAELARLFSEGGAVGGAEPPSSEPGPPRIAGRKPVRRIAKVAAVTTTAALAVTLAAAAQVLPTNTQPRTSIAVSGPATPVQLRPGQTVTTGTSEVKAGASAGVTITQPPTTVGATPPVTTRSVGGKDVGTLSVEALSRLPVEILRTLPSDVLVRLPVEVLRTLPGDALARLPLEVLRTLPGDALARLPLDVVRTLPGDALIRLPLDLLRLLPSEVQLRLPADVLRLLFLGLPPATTSTTVSSTIPTTGGAARP